MCKCVYVIDSITLCMLLLELLYVLVVTDAVDTKKSIPGVFEARSEELRCVNLDCT